MCYLLCILISWIQIGQLKQLATVSKIFSGEMMAPLLLACRLSGALLVFIYVVLLLIHHCSTQQVYDRAQLLDSQGFIEHLHNDLRGPCYCALPCLVDIPVFLLHPSCTIYLRNCHSHQRCGKHGGIALKLKSHLAMQLSSYACLLSFSTTLIGDCFIYWWSLEEPYHWIQLVTPDYICYSNAGISPRLRCGGVNPGNLRQFCCNSRQTYDTVQARMALINACSLVNKTWSTILLNLPRISLRNLQLF